MEHKPLKLFGRRETIQLLGLGLTASAVAACSKPDAAPQGACGAAPTPAAPSPAAPEATGGAASGSAIMDCKSPIDPASKASRTVMQYKDPAASPEKHCSVCSQYIPGKYGDCGGCKLFTGPVSPTGGCLSFAPLAGAAAPAKSG